MHNNLQYNHQMFFNESRLLPVLDERAAKLAADSPVSGNFANLQLDYYALSKSESHDAFWENYSGKKILDVCTGVSDFVAKLLKKGADAYALDLGYENMGEFLRGVSQRGGWPINSSFADSLRQNPERYIAGSAHKLPFDSNSFDAVTSHYGIFGVMDLDKDLLEQSVNEAVRVLKPNGILKIGPFQGGQLSDLQKANQRLLAGGLSTRADIDFFAIYPRRSMGGRPIDLLGQVTVVKKAA